MSTLPASIVAIKPLAMPWETLDPFLFCVHHDDAYPQGNGRHGPDAALLRGRQIGSDFSGQDGWSMYHGQQVPGFPAHPHRGFETVTIVRQGRIDHSDSLGAGARFGGGDVQWLTAGKGIVHAEMFPLLHTDRPNPLELFQIWLNLPADSKMVEPHFTMFWSEDIPRHRCVDQAGRATEVVCIAGDLAAADRVIKPLAPPPDSWASRLNADLAMWTLRLEPGAQWVLPAALGDGTRRKLYFFAGAQISVDGQAVAVGSAIEVKAGAAVRLVNGGEVAELLMLQGRPIGEPVAQYGPFVMNTEQELRQAFEDYRRTQFGGWPWSDAAPVHGDGQDRFARHADGRVESPASQVPPLPA
ncbi:redox-sensitive bicupin YhaK (pirin superfamily) [Pelomonas saccharophila]|uniref:Redox-sensitive bicupin YhaK (Pirin superfamily) n=1 Tax=Roseateles saccharophilus TaxID=304 RepID=A0ABU1YMJ1_ROSSA|nr:pirin family protein [Roseateles saccharophilus]MDR7269450.1 redox-sensitive bicupin YhaK (pirin superfamily) [Roseateles saccharophilus]